MAAASHSLNIPRRQPWWFSTLLKNELLPYPGRVELTSRMVVAATVTMILIMTFRLPGAALGGYYTLLMSRDSPRATFRTAVVAIAAAGAATVELLLGAALFAASPFTHFLWTMMSLFLAFYLVSVLKTYSAATSFGFLVTGGIAVWDTASRPGAKVSATLFNFLAVAVGSMVTVLVEYLFATGTRPESALQGVIDRLGLVERLVESYARGESPGAKTERHVHQFAAIGTGNLRMLLSRSSYSSQYRAALALSGRLIDIAATLTEVRPRASQADRERFDTTAAEIASVTWSLKEGRNPDPLELHVDAPLSETAPLLVELERNVRLLSQSFAEDAQHELLPAPGAGHSPGMFESDAFSNYGHVRFAIRGWLSAACCYLIYTGINWPGLSTALASCVVTALSNVGTSRQKQVLRIAGAMVGGCVFGFGSQAFLLPHMDSIAEFALLFAAVTGISAWVATSSPQLSYSGLQIALAFYLINLSDFHINLSLTVARDRVFGILLGLLSMWLIFDRLWATPAAVEMVSLFARNVRRISRFSCLSDGASEEFWRQYDAINTGFSQVRSQADAVLFEFRPQRRADLAMRNLIRAWQPELRTLFMLKLALVQYCQRARDGSLPPIAVSAQSQTDRMLEAIAAAAEGTDRLDAEELTRAARAMTAEMAEQDGAEQDSKMSDSKMQNRGMQNSGILVTLSHSLLTLAISLTARVQRDLAAVPRL